MSELDQIYHLGAVVKTNNTFAMVIGYDFIEQTDHLKLAYRMIPYPFGFNGSIKIIIPEECELLQDGFQNGMADKMAGLMEACADVAEDVSADEMKKYLDTIFQGKLVEGDE